LIRLAAAGACLIRPDLRATGRLVVAEAQCVDEVRRDDVGRDDVDQRDEPGERRFITLIENALGRQLAALLVVGARSPNRNPVLQIVDMRGRAVLSRRSTGMLPARAPPHGAGRG
jgi:hypothetical protein